MFLRVFTIIAILFFLFPLASLAENEGTAQEDSSIVERTVDTVTDAAAEVLKTPMKAVKGALEFVLRPLVVTPWGAEEYAYNVTKNVTVITKEQIEGSSASNVPELLGRETGIVVSPILGNPKGTNVDIRGFGGASPSNVLVLIDGRRANQIDLSGVDWAQVDLKTIEKIEIVRGASTVLYGDNATGGVINIITKRGYSPKPAVKIGSAVGSNTYHTEYGTIQGYHDMIDYFFNYSHRDEDGYRENNSFKANNWFGRVTLHPVEYFEFGTSVSYHKDEYGQPGALYQPDLDTLGRRGTRYPDDMAKTEDFFISGEPKVFIEIPDHTLTASVHGTYRRRKSDAINISSQTWHAQTTHTIDSGEIKPQVEVNSIFWDNNIDNTLILGTNHFAARDYKLTGNTLTGRDTVKVTKNTNALYIYDNVELLDRFIVNGGYRYEWADYKFEQKGLLTDNSTKGLNEWAYEVGGGYKYAPRSQIYITHSRSYRYPTTEEYHESLTMFWGILYGGLNAEIRQQVGHNLEIGIKDNTLDWLVVNADYFWIDNKHEIFYDINGGGNTNYTPRTRRFGFDIEAKANLMNRRLIPYINYTYQRAKFHGGVYDNNDFPLVPRHKLTAGVTTEPIPNLTWDVVFNYTGSRFRTNDLFHQIPKLNSYARVDTKISYKWKNLTIYGSINNVFNRKYFVGGATNWNRSAITSYPYPGTTFEIGGTLQY
jgi:iron complex outermembrane receptor protein